MTISWTRLSPSTGFLSRGRRSLSIRETTCQEKQGRVKLFSQTAAGRYVLIVLANLGRGSWKIVTARQMTDNERRLYNKAVGG
jgi:uncharacterized DUF497 family protein